MKRKKKKISKMLLSLTMILTMTLSFMSISTKVYANSNPYLTISDFTISGVVGEEITPVTVTITIDKDGTYWPIYAVGSDYTNVLKSYNISNFPDGLVATVASEANDRKSLTITITGTPTVATNQTATFMSDFVANSNCKYDIKEAYYVTVNYGTTAKRKYGESSLVTIKANTPETGKQFKEWRVIAGNVALADPKSATTTFVMPSEQVMVTAIYEEATKYTLLIKYSFNDKTETVKYAANLKINLSAPEFEGKEFVRWLVHSGNITLADSTSSSTSFTMPKNDVTIEIVYKDVVSSAETPTITAKSGSDHQISDGKDMTITCSGKLEDLTSVYVDGELLDASHYTTVSGSTILTLKTSYLDTLAIGKHILKLQYKDNFFAETDFMITAKSNSPQTNDTSNTRLYVTLIILSACVVGYDLKKKQVLHR